ncbi:MAG TPA: vanadium-dependent haloperoxidase, partial [Vicinamibacterales bacterium]
QLAVFEAVNAITGEYEPYLDPPTSAPDGASVDAAVIMAAHRALTNYFTAPATVAALDAARDTDLAAIVNGPAKTAGMAVGLAAANAMIALRLTDGSATPPLTGTPSPSEAGDYALTTGCASTLFFNWPNVTPFAIASPADFLLPAPPTLGSQIYAKDYYEVKTVGARDSLERPADRTEVVRLYAVTSPSFALSMATRQIAAARGLSLSEDARALALIMMGINDSLIASFYNKYHYNLWRPETGIRAGESDGNRKTEGDAGFLTFISTPCFPSYPSNHASGTNGGLEVMRRLFGAAGHDITISGPVPALGALPATVITKHYAQLKEIADDVDDARVYGGIHWRSDQVAGNALGRAIATDVAKNNLRPRHP